MQTKKDLRKKELAPELDENRRLCDTKHKSHWSKMKASVKRNYWLYLFLFPTLLWYVIFHYVPIGGIYIAFTRYTGVTTIFESKWVGLKWFKSFFKSHYAMTAIKNTLALSLYNLATFPIPVIIALALNEVRNQKFKKFSQTIMYAPHFISTVVLVSMLSLFFNPNYGFINTIIEMMGGEARNFMQESGAFRHLYVWSGVWQDFGWNCIIYVAALSSVDPGLHEAATIDGASRIQRILHINIPSIMPTIIITLILKLGHIMSASTDKVLLMLNELNSSTAEVIGTLVYDRGLLSGDFSYATAIGLFTNVVNFVLLLIVNHASKKVSETSLF